MNHDFVILNASDYPLKLLLSGLLPPGAVLTELGDISTQRACILTKAMQAGRLLPDDHARPTGRYPRLLLMDRNDPASQQTTKLYRADLAGTAYSYRLPCGDWQACDNPAGPCTVHYGSPRKNKQPRTHPILCRHCRMKAGPSQANREVTSERNRRRGAEHRARQIVLEKFQAAVDRHADEIKKIL